jgi:hypothetical protein
VNQDCHLFGECEKNWFLEKGLSGYISFLFFGSGACSFSFSTVHFRYIDLEYLVSRVIAGVIVKSSLGTGRS